MMVCRSLKGVSVLENDDGRGMVSAKGLVDRRSGRGFKMLVGNVAFAVRHWRRILVVRETKALSPRRYRPFGILFKGRVHTQSTKKTLSVSGKPVRLGCRLRLPRNFHYLCVGW
jgi:hypothetical protein